MANRSYLYSLTNRPAAYTDRPETISGISEWNYDIPFMYRLLMSGDPQLCASLISDGLDSDEGDEKVRLYAISGRFEPGFVRVKRLIDIMRYLAAQAPVPAPAPAVTPVVAAPKATSLVDRLKGWFSPSAAPKAPPAAAAPAAATPATGSTQLPGWLDETLAFLEAHRNEHLLLETVELDTMTESEEAPLRACVEKELARCQQAGAALDALPQDIAAAAQVLREAGAKKQATPLDAFFGLRFDDDCDSTRSRATEYPLGLQWYDVLYFGLLNRAEFEAATRGDAAAA
ncbi:hypothetical protein J2W24_000805 [Variovorax boronicumulans]|uniref:DUF7822 domain-containing protein n=1 Tax=Variovorax boronicumulans TaxID=436515 RepID=UPI002787C36A|nr:hypothetical protein [Variovorax boronicumulans]MDP9915170.1 hypothetical protein [Variovorax boronicumulans]